MILLIAVIALALALGLLLDGSLRRFEDLRLRWWGLVIAGLAAQFVPLPNGRAGADLAVRIVVLGGFLLFSSAASTFLENTPFIWKLVHFVPCALLTHIVVQVKAPAWGRQESTPPVAKLAAVLEVSLWLCVATAAVLIPAF